VDFTKQIAVLDEWCKVARQKSRPFAPIWDHIDRERVVEETPRKSFSSRFDVLFAQPDCTRH
jgi:hypothetical protein